MAVDTNTRISIAAITASIRAKVPVMLVGSPGTGKTAMLRELAASLGYELITIIGSQMDPTDVTGLPKGEIIMNNADGSPVWGTTYLAPWWQVRILRHKKVFLLLDEFSNTPGSIRASFLTMLQNREFPNGEKMPKETIIVGAMNASDQATDGYELDLPTTNRLFFIPWNPSAASWYEGMLNAWGDTNATKIEMSWRKKIVSFVKDNPSWMHREPSAEIETTALYDVDRNDPNQMEVMRSAWASRRSWDKLSQVLPFASSDTSVEDVLSRGLIGYAASAAFREWLARQNSISPEDVLNDPNSVNWMEVDLSDANLVLRAIVDGLTEETVEDTFKLFFYIAKFRTDLGAPYLRELVKKSRLPQVVGKEQALKSKEQLPELMKTYGDALKNHH